MKHVNLGFCLLLCSLAFVSSAQAARVGLGHKYINDIGIVSDPAAVFFDDFESGNFTKWNDYDGNPGPLRAVVNRAGPAEGCEIRVCSC